MKRVSRTNTDFNKHILYETHYKNPITGHNLDVWELKIPNTVLYRIIFVNSCGVLTVSGDFGRFSFCREFHPSKDGYVSDGYWLEKLKIGNDLVWDRYDSEETEKEIKELIKTGLEEYGYEGKRLKQLKQQLRDLLEYVDDEVAYKYHAFRGDIDLDYDMIPICQKESHRLNIIFDAFDYICEKMNDE